MKTINPFKRLNKEDFIPCSLFPASKVCDTSMDIGRATPLYCLDMVAGNRVSLDLSQLTRFQPMIAPVMTNYSIEYGAFFVPYVAFDEFFQSTWFRTHCQNTDVQRKAVLRAREFFNPAIDNSEKVHPWMFSTKRCGDKVSWVGSLYDHLRAPLGLPDWSVDTIYSSADAASPASQSDVNDWLGTSVTAGSVNLGALSGLLKNQTSIYPYLSGVAASWKMGDKPLSQLLLAVTRAEAWKNSTVQANLRDLFGSDSRYGSLTNPTTGQASQGVFLMDYFYSHSQTFDYSYISSVSPSGSSQIATFNNGALPTAFAYLSDLGFTKVAKNTGTAVTPYRIDCSNYASAIDVDKLYKRWWLESGNGSAINGTFSLSNGVVKFTASSAVADDGTLGKTALSSLFTAFYSGVYVFEDRTDADGVLVSSPTVALNNSPSSSSPAFMNFVLWLVDTYHLLDDNSYWQLVKQSFASTGKIVPTVNAYLASRPTDERLSRFQLVLASVYHHLFGFTTSSYDWLPASFLDYEDLFGKMTITQLQNSYRSYVESIWISANRNLEWNSVYWLAYQRIFADWFLNEHYTKHEDYLDLVGAAYIAGAQSLQNGDGKTMVDWFTSGDIADGNNPKLLEDPTLSYFADRIAKGECMPVLWSLDCVTNLRQSTSTSSTPIGQSITENFYNRFYARFKDLINRMGPDYRRNARALYGKGPDDASLLRSQVVGYKSFDMQIGDVAQNSESTKDSTLGQFAGYAVSRNRAGSFDWTAQESGVFVVLAWVRPKYTCFADLVPRSLYKSEYMDYLIPQFGGVGYQDFAYKQLNPTDANPNSRLGFEERYSEYMMMDNECSGLMRTSMAYYNSNRIGTPCYTPNTADFYHLLYMDEESDLKRVFVDNFNDPVLVSAYFNGNVTRQLPATIKTEF